MLRELYCRNITDPGYNPIQIETSSALESIISKIKMILFTKKGEVLGQLDLGLNLEDLLFEFGLNEAQLQENFFNQLYKFAPEAGDYNIKMEVNFTRGSVRDIAYIDILIDNTKVFGVLVS